MVSDGVLAVVVLVASGLLFPLAAVLCFVMKNKELDEKRRKCVPTFLSLGLLLAYLCVYTYRSNIHVHVK